MPRCKAILYSLMAPAMGSSNPGRQVCRSAQNEGQGDGNYRHKDALSRRLLHRHILKSATPLIIKLRYITASSRTGFGQVGTGFPCGVKLVHRNRGHCGETGSIPNGTQFSTGRGQSESPEVYPFESHRRGGNVLRLSGKKECGSRKRRKGQASI